MLVEDTQLQTVLREGGNQLIAVELKFNLNI